MQLPQISLADIDAEIARRAEKDLALFARNFIKIRAKNGDIIPIRFNAAQEYVDAAAKNQISEKGFVRIIVLKGRQQGMSTYIASRFFHAISSRIGARAFILTHEQRATENLFDMVDRMLSHMPDNTRPAVAASNANEINFANTDSGYKVGTAGNKAVGRSSTIQYLHGSETAYWPNAEEHLAGIMQAVPREAGTEIWLESTANGQNNVFHRLWLQAERGEGDFIPVFVPWFWSPEYAISGDITMSPDEKSYAHAYGLTKQQINWRRVKINELGGGDEGLSRFKREYPSSAGEAFEEENMAAVIPMQAIQAARRNDTPINDTVRVVWGIDPAGEGNDRSALSKRRGNHKLGQTKVWRKLDATQLCGQIVEEYRTTPEVDKPAEIFIDNIGIGYGIYCRLRELGLPVHGINWGRPAVDTSRFRMLKDELHWKAREWFLSETAVIPDEPQFVAEIGSILYERTSDGRITVEDKKSLSKRGIPSPDLSDSFVYTFAGGNIAVESQMMDRYARRLHEQTSGRRGSWMTA